MLNIAVLVSGGGTNLQALIDAQEKGELKGGRICSVISSSGDAYALTRAEKAGIETFILERGNYKSKDEFSLALDAVIEHQNVGLIVFAGFMHILNDAFCQKYKNRMINVHPSLVPAFSGKGFYGLKVHEQALQYGVRLSGATVHFVEPEVDGGPIILQKAVPVEDDDTPERLQARVMREAEHIILPKAVSLFCEGRLQLKGRRVIISGEEEE